ncbi:hypothetical protein [Streptomyces werraensis]|uniref:hypothetical protein n=1 Tax=Streptomyces werraensis TaxID=68284 RepID=UPI0036800794
MNPADELRTAAQTLMDLADVAQDDLDTDDYWKPYPKATAWRDGLTNGMGGTSGDLAAVFSPAVAHALAAWLRSVADALATNTHPDWQECAAPRAVAVARQINGGQP